jgi:glycosyltransferase involved in cell wall biosynthesis
MVACMTQALPIKHIALQFGHIKHFNEGLSEVSRRLGMGLAQRAAVLREERNWHFHFILPPQWHGMFGDAVTYVNLHDRQRYAHHTTPAFDLWHGLHQHMRYRPPSNSAYRVVTVHDLNHCHDKTGLSLWWQNLRLRRQLQSANRLVAISDYVRQDITRYWPWAAPVDVIYNGVADLSLVAQEPLAQLQNRAYFLHLSRMSPSKNVEALLGMAAIWPEKLFVLAGPSGPEVARHREAVEAMQLRNVVFMTDVSEGQKAWLYQQCEAFLFPSLMEGFGLPPIEAMYMGKPVVVARRSCLPEICGSAAFYWDDFDPHAMKKITEAAIYAGLSTKGFYDVVRDAAKRYSWDGAVTGYLQVYATGLGQYERIGLKLSGR